MGLPASGHPFFICGYKIAEKGGLVNRPILPQVQPNYYKFAKIFAAFQASTPHIMTLESEVPCASDIPNDYLSWPPMRMNRLVLR